MTRPLSFALSLLVAVGLVAGCGSTAVAPSPSTPAAFAGAHQGAPAAANTKPTAVRIPAIEVQAGQLMPLGLDDQGVVEVPPVEQPERVGWYSPGVTPGDVGPAVLLAHVNGGGRDGAFAQLHTLQTGDLVEVDRSDGRTVTFRISRVQTVPKDEFPTREVYGDTDGAELRLITCGGTYDPAVRSYEEQVIAYAQLEA